MGISIGIGRAILENAHSLQRRATMNTMAKQLAAARHTTFAQAYVQALMENPQLYTAYLAQHPRQSGTSRSYAAFTVNFTPALF